MAIRYKVVTNPGRRSCMCKRAGMKGYILTYKKGTVVKAIKGSVGILVFKRRHQAEKFRKTMRIDLKKAQKHFQISVPLPGCGLLQKEHLPTLK